MLKLRLTTLDGLEDSIKALYAERDGVFLLNLADGHPEDIGPLKRALEHERKQSTERGQTIQQLNDTLEALRKQQPSDIEKAWKNKLEAREKELAAANDMTVAHLRKVVLEDVVARMAEDLAGKEHAELLQPHIKQRLKFQMTDEGPSVRVLDDEGKPTALTLAEFREKLVANPRYAPLIKASRASGGGVHGNTGKSGGGAKSFKELTERELVDLKRKNPEEYRRLRAES